METKRKLYYSKRITIDLKTDWFCMQGVEKSQLAEDMDWLISELKVRQRDVGFTGEPEEVIHYASLLLGENLVTRFVGGRNFIVNKTHKIMQTETYQNKEHNSATHFVQA